MSSAAVVIGALRVNYSHTILLINAYFHINVYVTMSANSCLNIFIHIHKKNVVVKYFDASLCFPQKKKKKNMLLWCKRVASKFFYLKVKLIRNRGTN